MRSLPMIIVSLFEGLGNQMFQYATARSLAEMHSTVLKLDLSSFELNRRRKYGLHCFHIQENVATQDEINTLLGLPRNKFEQYAQGILRRFGILYSLNESHLLQERSFHFNPQILNSSKNIYLSGFWQSEKYFGEIRDILSREFTVKYSQSIENEILSEKIRSCESIALHVRRGDYINSHGEQHHAVCDENYYSHCITYIAERVANPHLFIFSDDPYWVKENLIKKFQVTIVEHNTGFNCFEDLRLMSQCKHNVIANSSFSWWSAWLNSNPDKIVCAPRHWFANHISDTKYSLKAGIIPWYKEQFIDTKDLLPENWLVFDNYCN